MVVTGETPSTLYKTNVELEVAKPLWKEMFAWPRVAGELEKIYEHVLRHNQRNQQSSDQDEVQSQILNNGTLSPHVERSTS